MAIVKVMQGELLRLFKTGAFQAIAHGCNCQNMMGEGIADQIHQQFPEAFVADTQFYQRMTRQSGHLPCQDMGGELSVAHTKHGSIFNLYTQYKTGRHGDYQLLQNAMQNLNKFCKQRSIQRVGVPLIGAGIAGLDILAVMTIMSLATPDVDLTVVVWDRDTDRWREAVKFRNLEFPRKFEGAAIFHGDKKVSLRTFETDGEWHEITLNLKEARAMYHNGEMALSTTPDSPYKLLVIETPEQYDLQKDRFYTK